jgi:lipid II isoglutaminyl synthase (glutamine-hydrolysing)
MSGMSAGDPRSLRSGPAHITATARRMLAVSAGKATRTTARQMGRGNGTAAPGKVALKIYPAVLASLAAEIPRGSVLVTGTNGKGTTCRMLAQVMQASGLQPVLNHEGSNQPTGLATTLLVRSDARGHLAADHRTIGLFEVDEGSLPEILPEIARPAAIVITNILRDQLDRYLEIDYLVARWNRALRELPADTALVLNADDPRVAHLGPELKNPRVYFGLEDSKHSRGAFDPTSDFPRCPRCSGALAYDCVYYAQLGHWRCEDCGLSRPKTTVHAAAIDLLGPTASRIKLVTPGEESTLHVPLPGIYNCYNVAAAAAAATACDLPTSALQSIEKVTTAFFRSERLSVDGREVYLTLAKNPNGYTEVLRSLLSDGKPKHMLLALNDRIGNQQPDVSWIWDIDFETLAGLVPDVIVSGNRAADLALRLKYAGWTSASDGSAEGLTIEADCIAALKLALSRTPPEQPLWVVSTYLVLWQMREWLRRNGYVGELWNR